MNHKDEANDKRCNSSKDKEFSASVNHRPLLTKSDSIDLDCKQKLINFKWYILKSNKILLFYR